MNRLVIATHNAKKAGEMVTILTKQYPHLEVLTLADFPGAPEPDEDGTTYVENASIKAESAFAFTGEWCLADDAGLEVDAMGGAPGLHSKRFAGEDTTFSEKMQVILQNLHEKSGRSARFRCCVALVGPGHPVKTFEATCEGVIADSPSGGGGFGYDPIFWLPELGCTMADLTAEQKHAISHRGKVLAVLADYLAGLV